MRIIISPAKKMNVERDSFPPARVPVFLEQTEQLLTFLKGLSYDEAKKLWGCNDKLASLNMERVAEMKELNNISFLTPAILSYEGIQYQYMAPDVFTTEALGFIQEHLRILSGFYGCIAPFDGVRPYRLEMQAKVGTFGFPCKTLYEFWGASLYEEVQKGNNDRFILNLASKEYSKSIEAYLQPEDLYLTVVFGERNDKGKVVQKGTMAKMARGDMVRFLAEQAVTDPEGIKAYNGLDYTYAPDLSNEDGTRPTYVFLKNH